MSSFIHDLNDFSIANRHESISSELKIDFLRERDGSMHDFSENFSSIWTFDSLQMKYKEMQETNNKVQMQLEDYRSFQLNFEGKECISYCMVDYFDRFVISSEEVRNIEDTLAWNETLKNETEIFAYKANVKTMLKINDYFFNHSDVIEAMEEQYKYNCDESFQCKKYSDYANKKCILDEELDTILLKKEELQERIQIFQEKELKLNEEREKLRIESEKNDRKNLKLANEIESYHHSIKEVKDLLDERKQELQKMQKNNEIMQEKIKKYDELIIELENKTNAGPKDIPIELNNRLSIATTSVENPELSSIITQIDHSLQANKNPYDIALEIIQEIKETVKLSQKHQHIDKIEKSILVEELKIKNQTINSYIKNEKQKLRLEHLNLEKEYQWLCFFKTKKDFKAEGDYINESVKYIMKEKSSVQSKKKNLNQTVIALRCLEENITRSIRLYKDAYLQLYEIHNMLDIKLKEISYLFDKMPTLFNGL